MPPRFLDEVTRALTAGALTTSTMAIEKKPLTLIGLPAEQSRFSVDYPINQE